MRNENGLAQRVRLPILGLMVLALVGCEQILPKRTAGHKLYSKHCSECHGVDGAGQTVQSMGHPYADLVDNSWRHAGDAISMRSVLSDDLVFKHVTYSKRLSSEEIKQIIDYVLVLRGERQR